MYAVSIARRGLMSAFTWRRRSEDISISFNFTRKRDNVGYPSLMRTYTKVSNGDAERIVSSDRRNRVCAIQATIADKMNEIERRATAIKKIHILTQLSENAPRPMSPF